MPRVFASLAIAALTLFTLTAATALASGGSAPDRHILLALGTLLLSCFIQVVAFTYLTVTGKVVAQAVHFAHLDPAPLWTVKQYKRRFTHKLALVMASVVLVSATGGAAWRSREALVLHIPAAVLTLLIHAWALRRQDHILRRNAQLVETTLQAYSGWREQRPGLAGTHSAPLSGEVGASGPVVGDAGRSESPSR